MGATRHCLSERSAVFCECWLDLLCSRIQSDSHLDDGGDGELEAEGADLSQLRFDAVFIP